MKPKTVSSCVSFFRWALLGLIVWLLMSSLIAGLKNVAEETRQNLDSRADVLEQSLGHAGLPS